MVIVEDNPADVLLVKDALKKHGLECSIEHYTNGEDAARAMAAMREAPSLFLLDLNLPRLHGLELLRIIRSLSMIAEAPVAILTSSKAPDDKVESEKLGANAYIIKPAGYSDFVTNVGSAI